VFRTSSVSEGCCSLKSLFVASETPIISHNIGQEGVFRVHFDGGIAVVVLASVLLTLAFTVGLLLAVGFKLLPAVGLRHSSRLQVAASNRLAASGRLAAKRWPQASEFTNRLARLTQWELPDGPSSSGPSSPGPGQAC